MGVGCSGVSKSKNTKVAPGEDGQDIEGEIYMICCGIDYACSPPPWSTPPLDTRFAFGYMQELAKLSGVTEIKTFFNQECNLYNIQEAIKATGKKCGPNDYFIFYYTGHGDHLKDQDGDEADGEDEAFCFLDKNGNPEPRDQVWLRDDDFANWITNYIPQETNILVLADACHSETVVDLAKDQWTGFTALSMCGCKDEQTSAGTGHGGMFTRALTCALETLQKDGKTGYPISQVWNVTLDEYKQRKKPGHTQNISMHTTAGVSAQTFVWPLEPKAGYQSPVNKGQ
jgi:hypothetical protein